MPYIMNENEQIYYETFGDGTPIFLTYGLGGSTKLWNNQIHDLASLGKLILWDQRGEGYSSCPRNTDDFMIERSVEDLLVLMNELKIDSAIVGGQSLGGGVSLRFALKYPNRTKALIVCNSHSASGLKSSNNMRRVRNRTLEMFEEGLSFNSIVNYLIENEPNLLSRFENIGCKNSEIWESLLHMFDNVKPLAYINMIKAMRLQDDVSIRLSELEMPVLLLTGDRDPSRDSMEFMSKKINNCVFEVVINSGHHANLDNPKDFNCKILRFINQLR